GSVRQCRLDQATQGGAISVVAAGSELLVVAADLTAAADHAARKWHDDSGYAAHDCHGGFSRGQGRGLAAAEDEEIAPGHALGRTEEIFTGEFSVHYRQTPVTAAIQLLAELMAVTEEAEIAPHPDVFVFHQGQAVVTGGCR